MITVNKIVLEVVEDDGQVTYREIDLNKDTMDVLFTQFDMQYNIEHSSEIIRIVIERVTSKSMEHANFYINSPTWRLMR